MSDNTLFELTLFDPENSLISLLESRNIKIRKLPVTRKFVVALDETIEIVGSDDNEALSENLASIFIEWLENKKYRKIQAQLKDSSIVYINDTTIEEIKKILKIVLKITAFDPEYNNRILNKQ
ncbi:MAG: hypothetical protein KUG73_05475 [Pseudomonadales bacterium]|nr:hypothetical protein [Pseudomonadales bacterium]